MRGTACSVAPAMINSTVYLFLTNDAARRGASRRGAVFSRAVVLVGEKSVENSVLPPLSLLQVDEYLNYIS